MKDANSLPYYPRFIFTCSDGNCFSTGDLEVLKKVLKESGTPYDIMSFRPGQKLDISQINEHDEVLVKPYTVSKIEVLQLKYDLDAPTYGINSNDCTSITGAQKKWMMEIYVFLDPSE